MKVEVEAMTSGIAVREAITVREAVALSGLTRQQVYNLLINGRVAAEKFGHVYRVDRRSLLEYLRSPRHQPRKKE